MNQHHRLVAMVLLSIPLLLGIVAASAANDEALNSHDSNSPTNKIKLIKPIYGSATKGEYVVTDKDNLDQCAGTLRRYCFPPSGYIPREVDAKSKKGKALYAKNSCNQCHSIANDGGRLGPPLDGIGGHRGKEWLIARLMDPESQMRDFPDVFDGRPNIMPHPDVSKKEAEQIAAYLLTLAEPEGGFLVASHPPIEKSDDAAVKFSDGNVVLSGGSSQRGAKLFMQLYCASCHTLDGSSGRFAPDLKGLADRRSSAEVEALLKGASQSPTMNAIGLSIEKDELEDLKKFLLSLPK